MKRLSVFHKLVLALSVLTVMACGKKKSDDSATVNAGRDTRAQTSGPSLLPSGQGSQAGSYQAAVTSTSLDEAAKILASATISPDAIGTVQSVLLQGQVSVNPQTGAILPASSRIWLTIKDSYVGQTADDGQVIEPISIDVAGTSGTAVNYQANLTFTDQYGTITITGTYNTSTFQGTISFSNTAGSGYNGKKSGTLGQFSIPTCSFFVCQ